MQVRRRRHTKTTTLFIIGSNNRLDGVRFHLVETLLIQWHVNSLWCSVLSLARGSFGFFERVRFRLQVLDSSLVKFTLEVVL